MDFYTEIKRIAGIFDVNIKTYMYSDARYESESLNFEYFPVIVISDTIRGSGVTTPAGRINNTENYSFRVMKNDLRDSFEAENYSGLVNEDSYTIAKEMLQLGLSILNKFKMDNYFMTAPTWNFNFIFKETANVLTGVLFNVNFVYNPDLIY